MAECSDYGPWTPRAALFDFDMTTVDSEESVIVSMNMFAREMGLRDIGHKDLMEATGLPLEEGWVKYWGRCEAWWPDYYRGRYKEQELSGFKPFADTVPVLERMREAGIRTAIVTNRWLAPIAVEAAGLGGRFDAVVGAEEAERPKPFPDPVLKALELLGAGAGEAVMVGDSYLDMGAAVAAGVKGIGVATGGSTPAELAAAGAWKTCGRLGEVLEIVGLEPLNPSAL
ncbi:MAG: HAD-IA family hydrolase [Deltaproteobacteria bacterium]|jgi:HAD superfamily hydrolase (TIGR01549 family)|nr:HAD-IA family hydrolase [Deltaproteobacteria bacterium]